MPPASNVDVAGDQRSMARRERPRLFAAGAAIARAVAMLIARSRDRRALAALDERLLRDIGIDRHSAAVESAKPPWRR